MSAAHLATDFISHALSTTHLATDFISHALAATHLATDFISHALAAAHLTTDFISHALSDAKSTLLGALRLIAGFPSLIAVTFAVPFIPLHSIESLGFIATPDFVLAVEAGVLILPGFFRCRHFRSPITIDRIFLVEGKRDRVVW